MVHACVSVHMCGWLCGTTQPGSRHGQLRLCLTCVICLFVLCCVSTAANRHIEADSPEPDRLPLGDLLAHLSGLTRLLHLHISSKADSSKAGWLQYSECELL